MAVGINNITNITAQNITEMTNITSPESFLVKTSVIIYEGYLFFILLWCLWFVLWRLAQGAKDTPGINIMYSGIVVTLVAFFLRILSADIGGTTYYLLTDQQMWTFPLLTLLMAIVLIANKRING